MTTELGWHFVGESLRDGRPVPADGEWLEHDGELVLGKSGLHFSRRLLDALYYASGESICRVQADGEMKDGGDQLVARRRCILWRVDGEAVLRAFARWCALQVARRWNAPAEAREYLETGNVALRAAARDAARDAASAAAMAAASATAWHATRNATWRAAWRAARDAQEAQLVSMVEEARAGKTEWVWRHEVRDGQE